VRSARDLGRAAEAAALGHRTGTTPDAEARAALHELTADTAAEVRAIALGALARRFPHEPATRAVWERAVADPENAVRGRACEVAPLVAADSAGAEALIGLLTDPTCAEGAAWALGEIAAPAAAAGAVGALSAVATQHTDALVREAAVAALGAIGDAAGLSAVLAACHDKPAVRRRAVVALAAFEGPEVDAAFERARLDKDWQVRQVALDLG